MFRLRFRRRKLFSKEYVTPEKRKTRLILFIFLWGMIFTWAIKTFIISLEVIQGSSMYPTFQRGEFYLVNKFMYNLVEPQRGDAVIIKNVWLREDELIKRVIGMPGDILEIKDGKVYLNGEPFDESYVNGKTFPDKGPLKVKGNMYFVMGDNREFSYDSRHFGLIKRNEIRSKISPGKLFTIR